MTRTLSRLPRRNFLISTGAALASAGLAPATLFPSRAFTNENSAARMTVSVDQSSPGAEIAPELYGHFIEHAGNVIYDGVWVGEQSSIPNIRGIRKDVVDALKPLEIPLLRWPGGCFADQYNWRDGIGPRDKRPKRHVAFYDELETNEFGTHEYLDFAELIGAKPYISINMGSSTALDQFQWLQYINDKDNSTLALERQRNGRATPWNVNYVGLGNEIWGCGGNMRPETAADETRRYGFYLDSDVVRYSPQHLYKIASGPSWNFPGYKEFTEAMMKDSVNIFGQTPFQALSLHFYVWQKSSHSKSDDEQLMPSVGFDESEWTGMLKTVLTINDAIVTVSSIMDKYDPQKKITLAFDEWDASMNGPQITLLKAEVAALVLNMFHRHTDRLRIASTTFMINIGNALIQTKGPQMVLTPSYHVFTLYKPFKGAKPYPVKIGGNQYIQASLPVLDASAAKARDGRVYLSLVNLDPVREIEVVTDLTGPPEGQVLTGPALDAFNEFGHPPEVAPARFQNFTVSGGKIALRMPSKSIVVCSVPG
jgi:alpha-L-arabinofuranosidase